MFSSKPQCIDKTNTVRNTNTRFKDITSSIQQRMSSMYSSIKPYMETGYTSITTFSTSNRLVDRVIFIFLLLVIMVVLVTTIFSLMPMSTTPPK